MTLRHATPVLPRVLLATLAAAILVLRLLELAPAPNGDMSIRSASAGYHDPVSTGPVSFNRFVCCSCYDRGPGGGGLGFFGTRRAAALHVSKSPLCRGEGKGIKTITAEYRDSKRAEDQEAGPVGAPGTWPARPAGSTMSYSMSPFDIV